jgi:hypothetical protein
MRKLSKVLLLASAIVVGVGFATAWRAHAKSANSENLIGISVEALPQPTSTVQLNNVELVPDIVARTIRLRYAATNFGTAPLSRFSVLILVFDPQHQVKMGAHFSETINLNPRQEKQGEISLPSCLYIDPAKDFGRFEVSIAGYGSGQTWQEVSLPQLAAKMRSGTPLGSLFFQGGPSSSCGSDCVAAATTTCGAGQVQSLSYSGTAPNCSCSFTCKQDKGPAPLQQ